MSVDTSGGHSEMDYPAHVETYHGFVRLMQFGVIACVIVLALMAIFLV